MTSNPRISKQLLLPSFPKHVRLLCASVGWIPNTYQRPRGDKEQRRRQESTEWGMVHTSGRQTHRGGWRRASGQREDTQMRRCDEPRFDSTTICLTCRGQWVFFCVGTVLPISTPMSPQTASASERPAILH